MPNLLYDPDEMAQADKIAVCVPGALSSKSIFDPVAKWRDAGYGLAFYRFPGLDERPISPPLKINEASDEIVALAQRFPDKPLRLLGYSTGGPIVITAGSQISGDVKIAAMSSAVEGGGGLRTGVMGLYDVIAAAARKGSAALEEVWMEYYRVLLFGRRVLEDKSLAQKADDMIAAHRPKIIMPDGGKPRAHTDDLRSWRLPVDTHFSQERLRFFIGTSDPVFSQEQTLKFARQCGDASVIGYPGHGHLLFLSHKPVFDDILDFFEGRPPTESNYVELG